MKKLLIIFFTFTLYFNLVTQANASPVGGWTMSNPVAQGASTLYDATKNVMINGKNVVKTSTALITPTATSVAKLLAKGVAGVALSVAVEQLLGAVDWVLDPANNSITYTPKSADPTLPDPSKRFCYSIGGSCSAAAFSQNISWNTANDACRGLFKTHSSSYGANAEYVGCTSTSTGADLEWRYLYNSENSVDKISLVANPAYDSQAPDVDNKPKSIPLSTVAAQVISNAESGNAAAQVATTAAAADMVKDAESDNVKARPIVNQLEENSKIETDADANTATGSQTQNPTKPETTDLKLEFPVFCNWAPTICEAAQTVIKFPTTLVEWWETAVASFASAWDWFTAPAEEPKKVDIPKTDLTEKSFLTNVITVNGAYCPADKAIEWDTPMGHFSRTVSYQNFCDASAWFGYLVLAASYYMGALIVVRDS